MQIFTEFENVAEMPHTLTYAILFKMKLDSLAELPKDKRPPRGLLDKPYQLERYLDEAFSSKDTKSNNNFVEFNVEEAE